MKYYVLIGILACFLLCVSPEALAKKAVTISLTQEEFDNLEVLDEALRKKYPQYEGHNGGKENKHFYGLPESKIRQELDKIDFVDEEARKIIKRQEEKAVRKKTREMTMKKMKEEGYVFEVIEE